MTDATTTPPTTSTKLTPCSPGDAGALEKTWADVSSEELLEPALYVPFPLPSITRGWLLIRLLSTYTDFVRAVQGARPTVTKDDVVKHIEFANEAGAEVSSFVPSATG